MDGVVNAGRARAVGVSTGIHIACPVGRQTTPAHTLRACPAYKNSPRVATRGLLSLRITVSLCGSGVHFALITSDLIFSLGRFRAPRSWAAASRSGKAPLLSTTPMTSWTCFSVSVFPNERTDLLAAA